MALIGDQWTEWLQRAATAVGGALIALFAVRRKLSADNVAISEDRASTRLLATVMAERDAAMHRIDEMVSAREKQFGACEERVRSLSEQVLDLKLALGRAMQEIARLDPAAAARLLELQVRPGPPGKGDEPP